MDLPPPPPPPVEDFEPPLLLHHAPANEHDPDVMIEPVPEEGEDPEAVQKKSLQDVLSTEKTNDWCLLYDNELQQYLKDFSSRFFSKTKTLQDSLDGLCSVTSGAEVRLNNALNQFLMLSNTQFIENRVYDEDDQDLESPVATAGDTTDEDPQVEEATSETTPNPRSSSSSAIAVVDKYRNALDMGLQAMKLFAMLDDDESMDEKDDPAKATEFEQALDIYNERPLPFIIGTREFLEDDTLGLGAVPEEDDDLDSESDAEDSDVSNDEDDDEEEDSSETSEEEEEEDASDSSGDSSDEENSSEEEQDDHKDLFGTTQSTTTEKKKSKTLDRRRSRSRSQTRMVLPPLPSREDDETSEVSTVSELFGRSSAVVGKSRRPSSLQINEDDGGNSLLYSPSLASASMVWSDDDNDDNDLDDDLFGNLPGRAKRNNSEAQGQTYSGLFGDVDEDNESSVSEETGQHLFSAEDMKNSSSLFTTSSPPRMAQQNDDDATSPRKMKLVASTKSSFKSFFGDDESDDDDVQSEASGGLFGGQVNQSQEDLPYHRSTDPPPGSLESPPSSEDESTGGGLFDDLPDSRQKQDRTTSSVASQDSDDESTTSGLFGMPSSKKKPVAMTRSVNNSSARSHGRAGGLFDDDDDDDESITSVATSSKVAHAPTNRSSLFLNDSELLSDEEHDHASSDVGLFGNAVAKESAATTVVQENRKVDLFGDDESDEESTSSGLFGQISSKPWTGVSSSSSLTPLDISSQVQTTQGHEDEDDPWDDNESSQSGLFGNLPQTCTPVQVPSNLNTFTDPTTRVVAPTAGTLYGSDDDDEEEDTSSLFGTSDSTGSLFGGPIAKQSSIMPIPPLMLAASASALVGPPPNLDDDDSDELDWEEDDDNVSLFGTSTKKS